MANERKTESIVRTHFEKFNYIHIEEQASDNVKIDKLLKTASKKGSGKGRPEFLITYNTHSDLLIVVECKADITKHESVNRDKYADFAVDGVLLYATYLSKDFDVLAIAVSGEKQQSLKVSHFLHLKNERKPTVIFGDKLLSTQDYLDGYLKSPEKFRQDYNTLLDFTKQLNEKLHTHKILESQRSLLISCILIALESPAFKASYKSYKTAQNLANALVQTVSNELESANIGGKKLDNLNIQFGFIKTDTSLSTKNKALENLIDEIDENINSFIKTHEYFDVLGQLYIEFLRYANSDKGLGIVLTPPHITEFFADLAQVNKNSVAYDNCTGTGGFLISAMKKMVQDAKGDLEKIKEIKATQLIGVEYQSHIFALAVSNMYIHQDGKTNIINGSCFESAIIKEIKSKKPTVGFLNPPYKADKKTDTDELEFVLNNLDCLVDGGTCVAIVPMQSAISQSGKVVELKKTLLEKHTLEAVLSMPDELFFNSKVNVVACVMVFTAHKPHPKHKETYFGYYKKDGFEKRKILGRIDVLGHWEIIKEKWVSNFINRKTEIGFSFNKKIEANDEWCAEAYLETNYSNIKEQDFQEYMLNYVAFLLTNKLPNFRNTSNIGGLTLNKGLDFPELSNTNNLIKVDDIFEVRYGINLELVHLEQCYKDDEDAIYFVSRTEKNNGVSAVVKQADDIPPNPAHTISVAGSGSVLSCFYQRLPYYSGRDLYILIPKKEFSVAEMLFYANCLQMNKYKYNYGRQANRTLKDILIPSKMPVKFNNIEKNVLSMIEDTIKNDLPKK